MRIRNTEKNIYTACWNWEDWTEKTVESLFDIEHSDKKTKTQEVNNYRHLQYLYT